MAASPSFIGTPRLAAVGPVSNNALIDGTGVLTTVIAGVAAGTRVLEVKAKAADASAGSLVNLFLSVDGGTTYRYLASIPLAAVTPGVGVDSAEGTLTFDNLVLAGTGHILAAAEDDVTVVNVFAMGGDL